MDIRICDNAVYNVEKIPGDIYIIKNIIDNTFCENMRNHINDQALDIKPYSSNNNVKAYSINIDELCMDNILIKQDISLLLTGYVRVILSIINKMNDNIFDNNSIPTISMIGLRKICGETLEHIDNIRPDEVRLLSCIIPLNNDYDDGIFSFPNQNIEFKANKGDVILFPPYWTHPHKVSAPLNGFRYTLNFWYLHPDDQDGISVC
jgi:hypothetical protein